MSATQTSESTSSHQPVPGQTTNGSKRRASSAKPKKAAAAKPKAAAKAAPAQPTTAATPSPAKQAAAPATRTAPPARAESATRLHEHPSVNAVAATFPGKGADADEIQSWGELTMGAVRQVTGFKGPLTFSARAA